MPDHGGCSKQLDGKIVKVKGVQQAVPPGFKVSRKLADRCKNFDRDFPIPNDVRKNIVREAKNRRTREWRAIHLALDEEIAVFIEEERRREASRPTSKAPWAAVAAARAEKAEAEAKKREEKEKEEEERQRQAAEERQRQAAAKAKAKREKKEEERQRQAAEEERQRQAKAKAKREEKAKAKEEERQRQAAEEERKRQRQAAAKERKRQEKLRGVQARLGGLRTGPPVGFPMTLWNWWE